MYTSNRKRGGDRLKKIIKITIIIVSILITNMALLINTVQAVENGEKITVYTKGQFERIIKKDQTLVKQHMSYIKKTEKNIQHIV